jgi:hypothetical protein
MAYAPTPSVLLADLSEPAPPPGPQDWNDDGVVIIRNLIPDNLIAAYRAEWSNANGLRGFGLRARLDRGPKDRLPLVLNAARPGGFPDCTPYMRHPALQLLCCYMPLAVELERLLGEPAGVHLNLTGWVSTERNWHQDGYLNPDEVGDHYAAVWIALADIHPDSGPFQYIPGSHRWHRLVREKFADVVDLTDPAWPKHSEDVLTPLIEAEIERRGAEVESYLPKRGDVLIWHPRLYHRGSRAKVSGAYRPALIAHMSGIYHRPDMPASVQHEAGGWFFPITSRQPVR